MLFQKKQTLWGRLRKGLTILGKTLNHYYKKG